MKSKIALLVLMLCSVQWIYGQAKVIKPLQQIINKLQEEKETFQPVSVFYNATGKYEEKMGAYTQLIIDPRNLQTAFLAGYKSIRLEIPQDGKPSVFVLLTQHSIHADDFELTTTDQFGKHKIAPTKGLFYYGVIEGRENSLAAISVFDNDINGTLSDQSGNYTLGKRRTMNGVYAFFNDREFQLPLQFSCGTPDEGAANNNLNKTNAAPANIKYFGRCVRIFIDCGFPYYQQQGSNTTNVTNYTNSIFNVMSTIYANDSITTVISTMNIWTVNDGFDRTKTTTLLNSFKSYYISNGYNGNIASHWTTGVGGGLAANINGLCSNNSYNVNGIVGSGIQNYPTYSWDANLTAHENGHTMGSPHTHSCSWVGGPIDNCNIYWGYNTSGGPLSSSCNGGFAFPLNTEGGCANGPSPGASGGTIMSYCHGCSNIGVNLANGFGFQPRRKILNSISNAACITVCTACNTNLTVSGTNLSTNNEAYWATNEIVGQNATAAAGSYTAFNAGVDVLLKSNFSVPYGATFIASAGCTPTLKMKRPMTDQPITARLAASFLPSANNFIHLSPNPFSSALAIKIDLEQNSQVSVRLYDMMGKQVTTIIDNLQKQKGIVQLLYNNSKLASGTYLCVVEINGKKFTEKVVKMK